MMAWVASNAHLPLWDHRHSLCLLGLHTALLVAESGGHGHLSLLGSLGQDTDALPMQTWFLTIIHCLNGQC